jgi:hypothetical protein
MSYAQAKQIALLRLELRARWSAGDTAAAAATLARLTQLAQAADSDHELIAELRRWMIKLAAAGEFGPASGSGAADPARGA